jgi:hypothetical protein
MVEPVRWLPQPETPDTRASDLARESLDADAVVLVVLRKGATDWTHSAGMSYGEDKSPVPHTEIVRALRETAASFEAECDRRLRGADNDRSPRR